MARTWCLILFFVFQATTFGLYGYAAPVSECSSIKASSQAAEFIQAINNATFWSACPTEDFLELLYHAQLHREHGVRASSTVHIIDVGANKGYSAAKYFDVWTPGMAFHPPALHTFFVTAEAEHLVPSFPSLLASCGACSDCQERAKASHIEQVMGFANKPNITLHVHSFEPSNITHLLSSLAQSHFFSHILSPIAVVSPSNQTSPASVGRYRSVIHGDAVSTAIWHLTRAAVGDHDGTIPWPAGCSTELCSMDQSAFRDDKFIDMPVTTVDTIMKERGIPYVDFLKIDTEGYDMVVLTGAHATLQAHNVGLLVFEYNCHGLWANVTLQSVADNLYSSYGYVCYMAGQPTLARITKCWDVKYERKAWSNVVCAHEEGFASALESMSFLAKMGGSV